MPSLRAEFDRTWPWLEASLLRYGPTHTKEDIWRLIAAGKAHFWPRETCAFVGEVLNHPTGLRTANGWLAGGDLQGILATVPAFEDYGRSLGCHRVIVTGRDGWLRELDGYRKLSTRMVKDL